VISINNLTVSFSGKDIFSDVGFHISDGEKIGLVGKNGAGKSTLMKVITGEQRPTSGRVERPEGLTIGYLPQIMDHRRGVSVLEEAMTAFDDLRDAQGEIDRINGELATRTDYESAAYADLIVRLGELSDILAMETSEPPEVRCRKVLYGLGFRDEDLDRHTETFSQGWNMRLELAKILLRRPRLLLLDEPTNHLDIESIEWFEEYLKKFPGAVLLVSHDRKFLDNVTNRTVEILLGKIHDYKVPYSQYLTLRAERVAQQTAAYENQQRMIEKTEDFINRFRYKPTKSNQVQSRIKALEKLERIEIDETDNAALVVKFPPAPRAGDVVYKGTGLDVGYPQKVVFRGADIEIKRGEKVALVGRNGEGKTTMMRVITGSLEPFAGESRLGHNVKTGYYAQNQEDTLDGRETVYGTLERIAVGEVRTRLRDILAAFLFRGEDIDKRVSVLSGGERARLAMACLMLQPYNLLALDEPTNHMDIRSKEILKQALQRYDGTLVVVSHDRDFLDGLVDKLYEFRDGKVSEHLGGVAEFLERRKIETLQELERRFAPSAPKPVKSAAPVPSRTRPDAVDRKKKNRLAFLERQMADLERKLKELEAVLSAPGEQDDIMELTSNYLNAKRDLDAYETEWLELQ
jgi:ATP-binding cassette subfamily F protein 3